VVERPELGAALNIGLEAARVALYRARVVGSDRDLKPATVTPVMPAAWRRL
jgi:hypothetical protein